MKHHFSRMLFAWLAVFVLFSALPCFASESMSPEEKAMMESDWKFHDIVDADFVKAHIRIPAHDSVVVIDSRPYKPKYVKGHLPTAVSIPYSSFDEKTELLPKDKKALLIFYCEGFACKLSHKSAKKAEEMGYENVKVFAAGFPGWLKAGNYAQISLESLVPMMEENKMLLVDSRPKKPKYDKGHIPSAISLPFSQFDALSGKLPANKDFPVVFYCGGFACPLSHKSAVRAMELGYTDVKVFAAGYPAWKKAYGAGQAAVAVKGGKEEGSIDIEAFKKIMAEKPDSIFLVDVRDKDEFDAGHFENSVNMNIDQLEENLDSLPTDKPIVFVCSTGARSGEAYFMMQDLKPEMKDVFYLEAGVAFKKDGSYEIKKTE